MNFHSLASEAVGERQAMQKVSELEALLEWLYYRHPVNVLEIGGMHGGTLWAWSQVSSGRLVCVDLQVLEGRMAYAGAEFELLTADSQSPETRDAVVELMGGERFDFVFIDGDHRYEAVHADAANWLPLVAPGGAIAFHDICHRYIGGRDYHDMWRFWQEFTANQEHFAIYDASLPWGGIGVALVPPVPKSYEVPNGAWVGTIPMPAQCAIPSCQRCGKLLAPIEADVCMECAA